MEWHVPFIAFGLVGAAASLDPGPALRAASGRLVEPIAQMAVAGEERRTAQSSSPHVLHRAEDGLFHLTASVDGVAVRFVVDTGANVTVLAPGDARRIRWRDDRPARADTLTTAGGATSMRWATIGVLAAAGHRMRAIPAALPDAHTEASLLGQDVLSRFRSVTQRGDRLVIE